MKRIIPQVIYRSVLEGYTDIQERNEAFNNLDDQSKRLEIAWDALQMAIGGKVKASEGWYWTQALEKKFDKSKSFKSLQKKFLNLSTNEKNVGCQVCQRGLMMLSTIRLGKEVNPKECYVGDISCGEEGRIGFTEEEFYEMEREYEHCTYGHPYNNNTQEKLANICCNILVNGEFKTCDSRDFLVIEET